METAKRTHRIVCVDDEADFLELARAWLEPRYEVVTLRDGGDCAEVLAGLEPDLVILDVGMEPDGFTVCRQMRADARLKSVPVVFLTASHSDMDFIRNLDAGGTAYLTKPLSRKKLLAALSRMILMERPRCS